MKITINVDCTPEEARKVLGLPDLEPFHKVVLEEMEKRLAKGIQAEDLEALYKLWIPMAGTGWEQLQKMFWTAARGKAQDNKEKS
ncbi:MAG: hypothetical protein D6763_09580 [Alphaproteobacteria bacterium]|nr:MAG: hypothetical protein D6763_09580 [Alphaproteobacteria bacterium]